MKKRNTKKNRELFFSKITVDPTIPDHIHGPAIEKKVELVTALIEKAGMPFSNTKKPVK